MGYYELVMSRSLLVTLPRGIYRFVRHTSLRPATVARRIATGPKLKNISNLRKWGKGTVRGKGSGRVGVNTVSLSKARANAGDRVSVHLLILRRGKLLVTSLFI